jgi:hypothetical protein
VIVLIVTGSVKVVKKERSENNSILEDERGWAR